MSNNELTECECDPCGDETCSCRGKRCDFCKSQEDKTVEPDFATELQRIVQKERDRIADNLLKHNEVCNFKAVTEEDCDVCSYLKMAAKIVRTGEAF